MLQFKWLDGRLNIIGVVANIPTPTVVVQPVIGDLLHCVPDMSVNNNNTQFLYICTLLYHTPKGNERGQYYSLQGTCMWSYVLKYETYSFVAPCNS